MSILFSYSGTTPATTVILNPTIGDLTVRKAWLNPKVEAAGREDVFVYDKNITQLFHEIRIADMRSIDFASLMTFLDVVDGISNAWDYTDPYSVEWTARSWNANELSSSMVRHLKEEIEIVLLITVPE